MNVKSFETPCLLGVALLGVVVFEQVRGEGNSGIAPRIYASPSEASNDLVKAARSHDRQAIREIFGPEVTNLWTGDQALDEKHFAAFADALAERCDTVPEGPNRVTLEIGSDPWPFPIPLIKTNGAWFFDAIAGEEEIINRHIGRDEYYAIGVCQAYVKAQREYANRFAAAGGLPRYAMRFKSAPGKTDGLYWPGEIHGASSPLSAFVAQASLEGYNWSTGQGPRPFHGYYFKILTRQGSSAPGGKQDYVRDGAMTGGFALVAYPIRWGESGVMTFIVNQDGVVYQRSLGEKTARIAAAMKSYNPDAHWTMVSEPGITSLKEDALTQPAR